MPKFLVVGKVTRTDDSGTRTIAEGSIVKEAATAQELKERWEADMRAVFRDGPFDTVEYHCTVVPESTLSPALASLRDDLAFDTLSQEKARWSLRAAGAVAWTNLLRLVTGRPPL